MHNTKHNKHNTKHTDNQTIHNKHNTVHNKHNAKYNNHNTKLNTKHNKDNKNSVSCSRELKLSFAQSCRPDTTIFYTMLHTTESALDYVLH